MKNKKGFTLIELLAVIIILALVSLIAIPIVVNTIENSKKKAFQDSVLIASRELDNYLINHDDFNYDEGDEITVEQLKSVVKHNFKSGSFKIVNGQLEAYFITDGKYCAMGSVKNLDISKDCTSLDQTKPNIYIKFLNVESNGTSVIVTLKKGIAEDKESGIKGYRVSIYNGENRVDTETVKEIENQETVTFNNLDETKIYKIVLVVENGNGITNSVEVSLSKPTTQVSSEGWAQSKTVTIIYPIGYTNTYSIDGGITWETYENPIEIINNNTTVHAKISNGSNYVTSVSQTVSQIDTSAPTVANVTEKPNTTTSKSITVTASGIDLQSDIYGYQFSSNNGETWTEVQRDNEYTFSNLSSGSYNIKVKVINNTYPNNGINEDNSLVSSANAISTEVIPTPTYSISPNITYAQSKTVTIDYHDTNNTYTHEYSLNGGTSWQTYIEPLIFTENGTVLARITDGTNTVTGYISGSSYSVSGIDTTPPSSSATLGAKTTSTVVVNATCADSDSGITKIEYSNGGSWIDNGTEEHYKFTNLTAGQSYDFKVRCTNGSLLQTESAVATGQAGNASIAFNPTRIPDDTTWATSVSIPVTYTIANVTSPTRYIKTNVAGTKLNINAVACGSDTNPGTCGDTLNAKTAMAKDVWYKVESNPTVTVAITTSNLTLTGVVHDGDNYLTSSTEQINDVDISAPSASAEVINKTTTTATVEATCVDIDSAIIKIEYNNGNGWVDNGVTTTYRFTELTKGQSYSFKVRCTNGAGTQTESTVVSETIGTTSISFNPSRTPSTSTWAKSVSVPVTYTINNVTSPTRYIKTNGTGTKLNINAIACGSSTNPGTCTDILNANTAMIKDVWYKVEENPTVTIAIDTANLTLTGVIHDGNEYLTSVEQQISNIDTSAPTEANVTRVSTTSKSITVTANGTDNVSPITRYQFSKDNGTTWEPATPQTSNEYTFDNLTTGTYPIKSRVYNGTYEEAGINNDNYVDSTVNNIATDIISDPTYSISPSSGWAQSKTVTITYPEGAGLTKQYSLNEGSTWETYTEPLVFTANGTVLAQVTDGTNTVTGYISGSSYSVSEIDTTPPSANASIGTRTTTSVVVNATCSDDSNITKIEYQKDGGSWIDNGTTTSYTFSSLSQGTSYNFKVRCTNGVSLSTESSAEAGVTKATAVFDGNGGSNGDSKTLDVGAQLGTLPSSSRSYTITYNTNSSGGTSSKTSETVTYTQNGWWTAASGGSQISTTTTMPSGGTTYYAQWTGGTTTLATITRTGYTCTWNTKSDGTGTSYASGKTSYTTASTHTLYARCTINQYTATFNGNGGSNGTSITKNYGATLGTLPGSAKANSVFDGWYTATSGGTKISSSTTMPAGGATYYAHWSTPTYTAYISGSSVCLKNNYGKYYCIPKGLSNTYPNGAQRMNAIKSGAEAAFGYAASKTAYWSNDTNCPEVWFGTSHFFSSGAGYVQAVVGNWCATGSVVCEMWSNGDSGCHNYCD